MKVINISGVIGWDVTATFIRRALRDAGSEDVTIEIASPGGFVYDGLEIFNIIKNHKGNVTTHLMGLAASMASYIALAGNKVTAEKNAIFMIHNVWGVEIGDHNDMRKRADDIEGMSKLLAAAYVAKTGKTTEEIRAMMDVDTFLFGEEIKIAGFVDEVIGDAEGKKADEIIKAKASIQGCKKAMDELEKELGMGKEDLQKAVALIKPAATTSIIEPKKPKEVAKMATLTEILEKNPEAKAEHEKILAEASKKVEAPEAKTEEEKRKADIDYAKAYLNNKDYPTLGSIAAEVIAGEAEASVLKMTVKAIDHATETGASANAGEEQNEQGETPHADIEKEDIAEAQIEKAMLNEQGVV